jgi:hypothetical protein
MADTATDYIELDCPWFDPEWLYAHPEFPLAENLTANENTTVTNMEEMAA